MDKFCGANTTQGATGQKNDFEIHPIGTAERLRQLAVIGPQAANLLEEEAQALFASSTIDGEWDHDDPTDTKAVHDEWIATAGYLRAPCTPTEEKVGDDLSAVYFQWAKECKFEVTDEVVLTPKQEMEVVKQTKKANSMDTDELIALLGIAYPTATKYLGRVKMHLYAMAETAKRRDKQNPEFTKRTAMIIESYLSTKSIHKTAELFLLTGPTIRNILIKNGISRQSKYAPKNEKQKKEQLKIIRCLREKGKTFKEIGGVIGISESGVRNFLRNEIRKINFR